MRRPRRRLQRYSALLVIACVSLLLLPWLPGDASAGGDGVCVCPTCPQLHCGGGPPHVLVFLSDYNASYSVFLNRTYSAPGNGWTIQAGVAVPLNISGPCPGSPIRFMGWIVTAGTVANPSACSTTYTPPSYAGSVNLMPIVNASAVLGNSYSGNWAGYADLPPGDAAGMECVQGSVTVPAFTIPTGDADQYPNYLFIWVGIGGIAGNESLWQAGMYIEQIVGSTNTIGWQPVYDAFNGVTQSGSITSLNSTNYSMPASMTAQVCTQISGYDLYVLTFYGQNGAKHVWSGTVPTRFFPNEASAEWVVEATSLPWKWYAPCKCYGVPAFSKATWSSPDWTDLSGTYTIFLDALGAFALNDSAASCGCGTQYVNPTPLTSSDTNFSAVYWP